MREYYNNRGETLNSPLKFRQQQVDKSEHGATMIEYALLIFAVTLTATVGIARAGETSSATFMRAAGAMGCSDAEQFPALECISCDNASCVYGLASGGGTWGTDDGPFGPPRWNIPRKK